uniref:histone deacetylase HDT1 isoform X2 n=1 Tax=Erigeron canadensis TaxID=72917 RepID=UPI001CB8CBDD|nr:histone deacetylase HDT1 isoform X2 [Erigeron canadensis]
MEFWGVEVKKGDTVEVKLGEGKVLHLSQACLGEPKGNKPSESVCLHITVEGKKLVLGTLHPERLPQQLFDLVFDKDFVVSHNWKNGPVYFYGYKADQPEDDQDESEDSDSDEEEEDIRLPISNGNKQETKKEENQASIKKKEGKQKVKIVEPEKDSKGQEDSSDSDDSDSDDSMSNGSDSEEDNDDSSGSEEESSDEEEETPQKEQSAKKRPNDSAIKTPSTDKKAKLSTPQKTDGKKAGGHVATPHPSKQAAKTPANKSNQKSPASAADGAHSCKTCNRSFKSDVALQSHNQAKHK